jgi:hypothetical protein
MISITYQTVVLEQLVNNSTQIPGVGLAFARTTRENNVVVMNEVFTPIDLMPKRYLCRPFLPVQLSHHDQTNPRISIYAQEKIIALLNSSGLSRELILRFVDVHYTFTDVYVPLKHQRDQTLV